MSDFTPTLEEFVYSWYPSNLFKVPETAEEMLYLDIKIAMAVGPTFVRTALYMRAGMTFMEAGYAATDTYSALKYFKRGSRAITILRSIVNPVGAVAASGVVAGVYVHTSPAPTPALRSEPGETSWWRSVAQAMTGTGVGLGGADIGL